MNRAIWIGWVCLVLQACGDDAGVRDDASLHDAPTDAVVDDAPLDAWECRPVGVVGACGVTSPPTAGASGTTCNPLTQAGCAASEKCTWLEDQDNPPIGHIGCAPVGTIAEGCACSTGQAGVAGYDDCVRGAFCSAGTCKPICDHQGGAPMCGTAAACTRTADIFESGGVAVAGLCDPRCDPLTQCASSPTPHACGATDPAVPNRGCYGYEKYSCSVAGAGVLPLTDRMMPRTNSSGNPYLNGCAPGFIPFFYEMTGSTRTLCTGYCAALEIDNTPAHAGNSKGNPNAFAKLPTAAAPAAGDGTCAIGKKGSHATSTCKFIWPYVTDRTTGELPPDFANGPHLDQLGVCQAIAFFQYDSDSDGTPDAPFPDCTTLPPHTPGDMEPSNDASDWGCQKKSSSAPLSNPRRNPALMDIRVGTLETIDFYRHTFD